MLTIGGRKILQRKFGGKRYTEAYWRPNKSQATEKAKEVRRKGVSARVVRSGTGYSVFLRD